MQKILTTVTDEAEADILVARLTEAGIQCMRRNGGVGNAKRGLLKEGRDVVVEEEDLPRAQKIMEAGEKLARQRNRLPGDHDEERS
jgi:Putative prokaryotic signal transducing protein